MLLPVQRPVLLQVTSHLVVLWKTESLTLESKSHSHCQLVQGPTVLIVHPQEGASTPRGGQEGITWTALETRPDVMASVTVCPWEN